MKTLFFSPEIQIDFDWKGHHFRAGSVTPHNKKQISEGLRDMSPESIRNRFLGSKRSFSEQELEYLTQLDGWNHYAFGIEEREDMKRGVAIIRLVRASHCETEAEVAITIVDKYQRMGLGCFLMDCITLAALERKIETLSFTFLPQNEAIYKLVKRSGVPISGPHNHDYIQLFLDLTKVNIDQIKSRLSLTLPVIGNYHLKT